jgi:predicted unusual protein kinase regulating ubiquinone biosynthesis (AarF/ABC1/UbiB family)
MALYLPHLCAGNILVMPGMKLGILDWGQTKKLDPKIRTGLAR